jgi:hypothetical protein
VSDHVSADQAQSRDMEAWLDRRAEPAPATLRARIADAVRGIDDGAITAVADISAKTGQELLARLLAEGCATRSAAPDLLAADALVTYSFEAIAEDTSATARSISERAARAMLEIARLGGNA